MALRYRLPMNSLVKTNGVLNPAVIVTALLLAWVGTAQAHRQPITWTDIELNADRQAAAITHRLHHHDAIAWLRHSGEQQPDLGKLKHRAKIALHAAQHTKFWREKAAPMTPEIIGAEVADNHLFIYLEIAPAKQPLTHVHMTLLMSLNKAQKNRVNILRDGDQHSLVFDSSSKAQPLEPTRP